MTKKQKNKPTHYQFNVRRYAKWQKQSDTDDDMNIKCKYITPANSNSQQVDHSPVPSNSLNFPGGSSYVWTP